jgi:hypothetical protein
MWNNPKVDLHYTIRCGNLDPNGPPKTTPVIERQQRISSHLEPRRLNEARHQTIPEMATASQARLLQLCPSCSRPTTLWHLIMRVEARRHRPWDDSFSSGAVLYAWERSDPMAEDIGRLSALLDDYRSRHTTTASAERAEVERALSNARRFLLTQTAADDRAMAGLLADETAAALEMSRQRLIGYQQVDDDVRRQLGATQSA